MKPYRIKHVPSGLYFQPKRSRGSNLSKNGKIYQTKANFLKQKNDSDIFYIYFFEETLTYKKLKEIFTLEKGNNRKEFRLITKISDWIIEEI